MSNEILLGGALVGAGLYITYLQWQLSRYKEWSLKASLIMQLMIADAMEVEYDNEHD